jgi:hypothetical protein
MTTNPDQGEAVIEGEVVVDGVYSYQTSYGFQADKSPVVVKGPFFPKVVNPTYRIREIMCNARIQSSKAKKAIF